MNLKKIKRYLPISVAILTFILLIMKYYILTDFGFKKEVLKLNYTAFPIWFDTLIFVIVIPLLVYSVLNTIFDIICEFKGI